MKFDLNNSSMLFSKTEIPDVFFTEHFAEAPPDAIKVYLYLLFYTKYSNDIVLNSLSKSISMSLSDVKKAIEYWEEKGLLVRKTNGYNLVSVQELELAKTHNPKISFSKEDIDKNVKSKKRDQIIETINNQYFQGLMSASWYNDIILWFKKYEFTEDVMLMLFQYCFDRGALHRNYVIAVADAWNKSGVKEYKDVLKIFKNSEKVKKIIRKVEKTLRLNRNLTKFEEEFVSKWVNDYKYNEEIIDFALKQTSGKSSISFNYIDALITDWNNKELKTLDEVIKYTEEYKKLQNEKYNKKSKKGSKNIKRKQTHTKRNIDDDEFAVLYE